jgi:Sec7-like guanine-nucleotide exchange factor
MDKEIIDAFKEESKQILAELSETLASLKTPKSETYRSKMADFAQKIDRIMGTAQTLSVDDPKHSGLKMIGQLGALCKSSGYKSSETVKLQQAPLLAAFWTDCLTVISELIDAMDNLPKTTQITSGLGATLLGRLEGLNQKLFRE